MNKRGERSLRQFERKPPGKGHVFKITLTDLRRMMDKKPCKHSDTFLSPL
ncbi:MAG: hypothetical protein AAFW47_07465 [Pseudomonadota bacterium]